MPYALIVNSNSTVTESIHEKVESLSRVHIHNVDTVGNDDFFGEIFGLSRVSSPPALPPNYTLEKFSPLRGDF